MSKTAHAALSCLSPGTGQGGEALLIEEQRIHHGRPVGTSQEKLREPFPRLHPPLASNRKRGVSRLLGKPAKRRASPPSHCGPAAG